MTRVRWLLILLSGCAAPSGRDAEVARVIGHAEELTLRARPALVAGKFARMASAPFEFYRGNLALFRHDWETGRASHTAFDPHLGPVWGLGDPHPENFGLLVAGDGTPGLEPNDFDSADLVPWLFDLRRLLVGVGVGLRQQAPEVSVAQVTAAIARSYADSLLAYANGAPIDRVTDAPGPVFADLLKRSAHDQATRSELASLTVLENGQRRLVRGVLDPSQPTQTFEDLPAFARDSIQSTLARLGPGPEWAVLDAVREFGSGVSSWPRVRFIVLVRGPSDDPADDLLLEVKEQTESALAGWYPVPTAQSTPARVESALRRAWARPDADPRWFTTTWLGFPVQVRTEADANKNLRISRWVQGRATQAALTSIGETLGHVLARVHARSDQRLVLSIANAMARDADAFAFEQASFATEYSAQVERDSQGFGGSLGALGPLLGFSVDPRELPTGPTAALLGSPP
jgi:uncharacterized protein (DUF2252 family)